MVQSVNNVYAEPTISHTSFMTWQFKSATRRVQCSPTTKRVKLTVQSIKQHVCLTNNISYKLEDQFKSASCIQQKECNVHQQQKQQNLDRYSRLGSPINIWLF